MRSRGLRTVGICLGLALLGPLVAPDAAVATPPPDPVVGQAGGFLLGEQQADGGFDVGGVAGRETPDAVFALAVAGQKGMGWDAYGARASLQYVRAFGKTPFDALEEQVGLGLDIDLDAAAALAAKVLALVALPLGVPATDFDPAGSIGPQVDLLARIDLVRRSDGSYDMGTHFDGVLYAAMVLRQVRPPVPSGLVNQILAAQNADGSWSATGRNGSDGDIITTSLALLALKSVGRTVTDPAVARGVVHLAAHQRASGAWQDDGLDDPNATSLAAVALSALHVDVTTGSWPVAFGVAGVGGSYRSPYQWLVSRQEPTTGRFKSPKDYSGITTLPTSQAVQALGRQWHLDREYRSFAIKLSRTLGTPNASPGAAATEIVVDSVGPNVAIGKARARAAAAVLTSQVGREAAAADLFKQALGRTIDASGRAFWSKQLITIPRPVMLSRLTGAPEFYRTAGGTNPTFVDSAYRAVLGRHPDAPGRAYWVKRLDQGVAVEQIASTLVASTEYRRRQVNAAYQELLGRDADAAGSAYWTAKLANTRIEALIAGIAGSRELFDRL